MAFDGHITIDKGSLRDLMRSLDNLPKELQKSAEKAVLRAGGKPILAAARAKVPVDTGNLKKSLGVSVHANRAGWISARVGPRKGFKGKSKTGRKRERAAKGKRGTFQENKLADAQEISWYVETGTPRSAARPFIRPAIDSAAGAVLEAMAAGLDQHLTRVTARLARR
jgi:HK97 gp10 family phage protein